MLAHDLIVWTQALVLDGELAKAETQEANPLPAAARRRAARVLRPTRQAPPPEHLALGHRAQRRVQTARKRSQPQPADTSTSQLTPPSSSPATATITAACRPARRPSAVPRTRPQTPPPPPTTPRSPPLTPERAPPPARVARAPALTKRPAGIGSRPAVALIRGSRRRVRGHERPASAHIARSGRPTSPAVRVHVAAGASVPPR